MKTSATNPEGKRLRWFVPTAVDQIKSSDKSVEGAKNRPQIVRLMPEPPYGGTKKLDLDSKWYQRRTEGILLGECQFIWLDSPELIRAWRLTIRPWKFIGKTRPELPSGNVDWPIQQYRFAIRSLTNRSQFQSFLSEVFQSSDHLEKWHCRDARDIKDVMNKWTKSAN